MCGLFKDLRFGLERDKSKRKRGVTRCFPDLTRFCSRYHGCFSLRVPRNLLWKFQLLQLFLEEKIPSSSSISGKGSFPSLSQHSFELTFISRTLAPLSPSTNVGPHYHHHPHIDLENLPYRFSCELIQQPHGDTPSSIQAKNGQISSFSIQAQS